MDGRKIFVATFILLLFFGWAHASTVYLYPSSPTIDSNQTVSFIASTTTCFLNLPYNACKDLSQTANYEMSNVTIVSLAPFSNGIYNYTGITINGSQITFSKSGTWMISAYYTNSSGIGNYSTNSIVTVNPLIKVSISPHNPDVVYQQTLPLIANVTGGTSPYIYQWYNGTSCSNQISNANSSEFTTNSLNTSFESYCIVVQDSFGESASAITNISVSKVVYTSNGVYYGNPGNDIGYSFIAPSLVSIPGGAEAFNVTSGVGFNVSVCGHGYSILEQSLGPDHVTILIDGTVYNLFLNMPLPFGQGCSVSLANVSWAPILQTSDIAFWSSASVTSSIPVTSTATSSSSTVLTTSIPTVLTTLATTTIPVKSVVSSASNVATPKAAVKNVSDFTANLTIFIVIIIGIFCIILFILLRKKPRGPSSTSINSNTGMVDL